MFAEKRTALIGEIETAEAERRAAADRLAEAENRAGRGRPRRPRRARGDRQPRAKTPPAPRSASRPPSAASPTSSTRSTRCSRSSPPRSPALAELKPDKPNCPNVADVEAELERLRRERERLGAVNLRAEEELREVETQHTTLDHRARRPGRGDQAAAPGHPEPQPRSARAAAGLVRGGQRRTSSELFTELFGGGTAELQLVEADDPLEAGLEIIAKPPGKKPATLSLLSGGEQALTALALIFAVFLTNPAPICVLDEVDAPLDDHNVERFCDLLDEMTRSTDTRFVIITHNPITMARMNRLFGVTMAERGVSQLVSVDLEGAVKLREAS